MSDLDSFFEEIDQIEATISTNPPLDAEESELLVERFSVPNDNVHQRSLTTVTDSLISDSSGAEQSPRMGLSPTSSDPNAPHIKEPLITPPTDTIAPHKVGDDSLHQRVEQNTSSQSNTIISSFKPAIVRKKPLIIAAPSVIKSAPQLISAAPTEYSISKPAAPKPPVHIFGSDILFNAVTEAFSASAPRSSLPSVSHSQSAPLLPSPTTNSQAHVATSHNIHAYAAAGIPMQSPTDNSSANGGSVGYNSTVFTAGVKRSSNTVRRCAGEVWEDKTLADWPENDYRLFCGDLGGDVTDAMLAKAFSHYPSFAKARMVIDKNKTNGKLRGYGFVSFLDPWDCLAALKNEQVSDIIYNWINSHCSHRYSLLL